MADLMSTVADDTAALLAESLAVVNEWRESRGLDPVEFGDEDEAEPFVSEGYYTADELRQFAGEPAERGYEPEFTRLFGRRRPAVGPPFQDRRGRWHWGPGTPGGLGGKYMPSPRGMANQLAGAIRSVHSTGELSRIVHAAAAAGSHNPAARTIPVTRALRSALKDVAARYGVRRFRPSVWSGGVRALQELLEALERGRRDAEVGYERAFWSRKRKTDLIPGPEVQDPQYAAQHRVGLHTPFPAPAMPAMPPAPAVRPPRREPDVTVDPAGDYGVEVASESFAGGRVTAREGGTVTIEADTPDGLAVYTALGADDARHWANIIDELRVYDGPEEADSTGLVESARSGDFLAGVDEYGSIAVRFVGDTPDDELGHVDDYEGFDFEDDEAAEFTDALRAMADDVDAVDEAGSADAREIRDLVFDVADELVPSDDPDLPGEVAATVLAQLADTGVDPRQMTGEELRGYIGQWRDWMLANPDRERGYDAEYSRAWWKRKPKPAPGYVDPMPHVPNVRTPAGQALYSQLVDRPVSLGEPIPELLAEAAARQAMRGGFSTDNRMSADRFDALYPDKVAERQWTQGAYVSVHRGDGIVLYRDHEPGVSGGDKYEVFADGQTGDEARDLAEALETAAGDAEDHVADRTHVGDFIVGTGEGGQVTLRHADGDGGGYTMTPDQSRSLADALDELADVADEVEDEDDDTPPAPDGLEAEADRLLAVAPPAADPQQVATWLANVGRPLVDAWLADPRVSNLSQLPNAAVEVLARVLQDMNHEGAPVATLTYESLQGRVWAAMVAMAEAMRAGEDPRLRGGEPEFVRGEPDDFSAEAADAAARIVETIAGDSLTPYQREVLSEFTRAGVRKVATPEGADFYDAPIGTPIKAAQAAAHVAGRVDSPAQHGRPSASAAKKATKPAGEAPDYGPKPRSFNDLEVALDEIPDGEREAAMKSWGFSPEFSRDALRDYRAEKQGAGKDAPAKAAAEKVAPARKAAAPAAHRRPSDIQGAERRTLGADVAKRYEAERERGWSHTEAVEIIAGDLSYDNGRGRDFTLTDARTLVRDLLRENDVDTGARRPAKAAKATPAKATRPPKFDPAEVAGRVASQKTEADVIKVLSADPTLTSAKLRRVAEHLGIDVPDNTRAKSALVLLIAENEANERGLPGGFDSQATKTAPAKAAKATPAKAEVAQALAGLRLRTQAAGTAAEKFGRDLASGRTTPAKVRQWAEGVLRDNTDEAYADDVGRIVDALEPVAKPAKAAPPAAPQPTRTRRNPLAGLSDDRLRRLVDAGDSYFGLGREDFQAELDRRAKPAKAAAAAPERGAARTPPAENRTSPAMLDRVLARVDASDIEVLHGGRWVAYSQTIRDAYGRNDTVVWRRRSLQPPVKATPAKATPRAGFDAQETARKLGAAQTRDEAREVLQGLGKSQLLEVSKATGTDWQPSARDAKDDIVERLASLHVGGRETFAGQAEDAAGTFGMSTAATPAKATPRAPRKGAGATPTAEKATARNALAADPSALTPQQQSILNSAGAMVFSGGGIGRTGDAAYDRDLDALTAAGLLSRKGSAYQITREGLLRPRPDKATPTADQQRSRLTATRMKAATRDADQHKAKAAKLTDPAQADERAFHVAAEDELRRAEGDPAKLRAAADRHDAEAERKAQDPFVAPDAPSEQLPTRRGDEDAAAVDRRVATRLREAAWTTEAREAGLSEKDAKAYAAYAADHPDASVAEWQASWRERAAQTVRDLERKGLSAREMRELAASVGLEIPANIPPGSKNRTALFLATRADHPGLAEALAALPDARRDDFDPAAVAERIVPDGLSVDDIVARLGPYGSRQLRKVASELDITIPPGLLRDVPAVQRDETLRRFIAETVRRDRGHWHWRSADSGQTRELDPEDVRAVLDAVTPREGPFRR